MCKVFLGRDKDHYKTADTFVLLREAKYYLNDVNHAKELFIKANAIFIKYDIKPDIKYIGGWIEKLS